MGGIIPILCLRHNVTGGVHNMERTSSHPDRENRAVPNRQRDGEQETGPSTADTGSVGTLQRTMGNQSVQQLCENSDLQAKLHVSQPDDPAEREAERVADQVVRVPEEREASGEGRGPSPSFPTGTGATVRPLRIDETPRQSGATEIRTGGEPVERMLGSTSGGRSLPRSTRAFFEPRFGREFEDVRIHNGRRADEAARSIDAVGFTHGTDIAFRSGAYRPGTPQGTELLAHELVHVVQQDESANPRRSVTPRSVAPDRDRGDRSRAGSGESASSMSGRRGLCRRHAEGVVLRTPDDGGRGGYTPAPGTRDSTSSGGTSTGRPMESSEDGSSFRFSSAPERDPTCSDLSENSKSTLRRILQVVGSEVDEFESWRSGEGWDSLEGQRIPETERLQTQFQKLTETTFVCADDPTKGVPADDPLVKEYLFRGVGDQEGLSETDVNHINEWMRYEGERSIPSIQSYFGLSPEPIQHYYGVQVELGGTVAGVGAGIAYPPARPELFGGGINVGCYVDVEGNAQWLEFSYSNDLGMRWTVEYLGGDVSLGPECSIGASAGDVETSFGSEDLCTGAASSTQYYGPSDFAGSKTEWDAGAGVGLFVGIKAGGGEMTVYPSSGLPALEFYTAGACGRVVLGGEVTIGEGVGSWGGQIDISNAEVTTAPVKDVFDLVLGPLYEIVPDGWRTVVTRHLFYDTGSSDTLGGAYADHNMFAIRDITEALDAAGREFPPDEVEFVLSGHASPRWRAAESPREAAEENTALAGRRVEDARNTILTMYSQYEDMDGWPPASFAVDRVSVVNLTEAGPFTLLNLGPSEGLAETGDPQSNAQLYRRVTAELNVAHFRESRLNVLDLDIPEGKRVLYCPFLPQSLPSE